MYGIFRTFLIKNRVLIQIFFKNVVYLNKLCSIVDFNIIKERKRFSKLHPNWSNLMLKYP